MATDNSSDERQEENNNSSDECKEDNSSDDENEKEKDNSSDEISEKDNSSDPKAAAIKKRKTVIKKRKAAVIKKSKEVVTKKRKIVEEDDTEETLQLLLRRNKKGDQEIPPGRIRVRIPDLEGLSHSHYTKCIYKQLTESDVSVSQNRLMLGKQEVKDHFLCRLAQSEIPGVEGTDVLVYGPDGNVHQMKFKIRIKNTPVLTNGWIEFVQAYGLRKYSDFLTIWMFRATQDRQICFAIDSNRYDITKQLSKRILKKVFKY